MGRWIQIGKFESLQQQGDYINVIITEPFIYQYNDGRIFTVPIGHKSDGASIPDLLESMAGNNMQGHYVPAAFIHDYLCWLAIGKDSPKTPICSWADAHKIFYYAMLDNGCRKGGLKGAWMKYKAVQIGMFFKRWKY
jgi:hypothetical protein